MADNELLVRSSLHSLSLINSPIRGGSGVDDGGGVDGDDYVHDYDHGGTSTLWQS